MDFPFKNEFEYDWCVCAFSKIKQHLLSLRGSRWFFWRAASDTLSGAVLRFLHFADKELSLSLTLTVSAHPEQCSATHEAFPFAEIAQTPLHEVDYSFFSTYGSSGFEIPDIFSAQSTCCIFATDTKDCLSQDQKSSTCRTVVLQADVLLAPTLYLPVPSSKSEKYNLCYITDFLTALILAATDKNCHGTYRVVAWETNKFDQLLSHPQQAEREPVVPSACSNALRNLGWAPSVDLSTMMMLQSQSNAATSGLLWLPGGHNGNLPAIQFLLLRILLEVKRICNKHDIRYFLGGGTLLGAVRHQGFIPWDDDMDIMMLREDYDRFIAVAQQELPEELFLQTPKTEAGNHYLISKIRLKDTVFCSEFLMQFPQLENGIFVDIIAQDYTANSRFGQKLHLKLSLLARGLVFKKWSGESAADQKKAYAFFDAIKHILPFSFLEWFQRRVLTLFSKSAKRRYLYDSMGINISKGSYPAAWLSESVPVTFEGQDFPAPIEYDAYLRYLYGNYMQPVPLSSRKVVHSVPLIDLGPYSQTPDKPFHYR